MDVSAVLQMLEESDDEIIFSGSDDDFCITDSSCSDEEIEENIVTIDVIYNYENIHEVIFIYSSYSLLKMKMIIVMMMMMKKKFVNNWQTMVEEDKVH